MYVQEDLLTKTLNKMAFISRQEEKHCFTACSEDKVNEGLCDCTNKMKTTKPLPKTVAIDRQKDYVCKDEIYCNWYECPSCKSDYVRSGDNFCSNCGCKFEWSGHYC